MWLGLGFLCTHSEGRGAGVQTGRNLFKCVVYELKLPAIPSQVLPFEKPLENHRKTTEKPQKFHRNSTEKPTDMPSKVLQIISVSN